jgi:hypothetical protein
VHADVIVIDPTCPLMKEGQTIQLRSESRFDMRFPIWEDIFRNVSTTRCR